MTATIQQYGLGTLSSDARLTLANELFDSVMDDLEAQPLTLAQRTELERRIALADADPSRGTPWETVLANTRARWGRA